MEGATAGTITDLGEHRAAVAALPTDVDALVRVVQGLVVHHHLAASYGVELHATRVEAVHERRAAAMLDDVLALDPSPLEVARPPERRLAGNCRQISVLLVALLRAHGTPARARCGFGTYFLPGFLEDHWVAEVWDAAEERWRLVDAQLDELQTGLFGLDLDPRDVPRDRFVVAGDAWQQHRAGVLDADRCGLSVIGEAGWWWIASNLVRDAAALTGHELLPWDCWGAMPTPADDPDDDLVALLDHLATLTTVPDQRADELADLMATDPRLRVPDQVLNALRGTHEAV